MYFGSDNQAGVSAAIMQALVEANQGIAAAYSDDEWTHRARAAIADWFECDADVHFVSTGTAANCLALACSLEPWQIALCHGQAHIINDELTAPEFFTGGARLLGLDAQAPKLSAITLGHTLSQGSAHPPHNAEPAVLSLTQLTESGQVYSLEELRELTDIAHQYGLIVHMDGARFTNALVSLDCSPAEMTWRVGIDVLSLGATKNGAMTAEAVIFFKPSLAKKFVHLRKRSGHLLSKSRWISAQFLAWLKDDHWRELALHANQQARQLSAGIAEHPKCRIVWPTQGNEVFAVMPKALIQSLRDQGGIFYEWTPSFVPAEQRVREHEAMVRLVCSFQTKPCEVVQFIDALHRVK
ncbi:low specificity L-threonine aldolase [Nitrincola tibetensis]|uniref:L-threonine aldolase n=1 Tax=Nitrincola tibetensis TaxID=2219697 RepID=A0A364NPM5_9GAMM|nr:low specificity L-threonine aldolase [Nitrincola tibetensis]RAU18835.1 low specificity L-threonine aldolase [Nitrincola tibetensis]